MEKAGVFQTIFVRNLPTAYSLGVEMELLRFTVRSEGEVMHYHV